MKARVEEIFQQVMSEGCENPLHRFAELVRQDERERIWIGLTDKEIFDTLDSYDEEVNARQIEALLKKKNT